MYIAKPVRLALCAMTAGASAGVVLSFLQRHIGIWAFGAALISIPVIYFISEGPVNKFDFWLRKVTRDAKSKSIHCV